MKNKTTTLGVGLLLCWSLLPLAPAQALDAAGLSAEAGACTDFYGFVNDKWEADTAMPADRSRIGSFDSVRDMNQRALLEALGDALAFPDRLDTPGKRLATAYYASGVDTAAIERRGISSLAPMLAEIDAARDGTQLARAVARLQRYGVGAPFNVRLQPDAKDKRQLAIHLQQGGLGLPEKDDYAADTDVSRRLRAAYRVYLVRLLTLAESGDAERTAGYGTTADAVIALERRFAEATMSRVAMRDPNAIYHPHTLAALQAAAGGFDWAAWLEALAAGATVAPNRALIVTQPRFLQEVAASASDVPIETWRAYLKLRLLDAAAVYLSSGYTNAHFAFHSRELRGTQRPMPRPEIVVDTISGRFGELPLAEGLGELFVARAFSPLAKERAVAMVADIRAAMRARIEKLEWMSPPTRERALRKLDAMALKIGYPDRWKTYAGLRIERDDYAGNWMRVNEWALDQELARLDQPVDRTRWFTAPHTVNAFAGSLNEIIFPAGILQPPFFDARVDDAVNYGGIGAVIGHEITHHFDDRGRQFDEVGNLSDWWSAADAAAYRERAARLARQYSGYEPLPGAPINGQQTLGENISDLGGVQIAYDGLQRALARQPGVSTPIASPSAATAASAPGGNATFTPSQRFFLSYATIWRSKSRTEAMLNQIRTGNHSPSRYRVLGPLANFPAFAEAFGCPRDASMARSDADRVVIW